VSRCLGPGKIAGTEHDLGSFIQEKLGNRFANAHRCAGHDCNFAIKFHYWSLYWVGSEVKAEIAVIARHRATS
jgi:hypothetical protein